MQRQKMKRILFTLVLLCFSGISEADRTSKWDYCECRFLQWNGWSACTKTCAGGYQERMRQVHIGTKGGCTNFTDCATNDMGWDTRSCNTICYGGGTYVSYTHSIYGYCSCPQGKIGDCCEQIVTCGAPSQINHGKVSGSNYNYGHSVIYTCDTGYNMTNVLINTRTCTGWGYWSGVSPTCLYARSCDSHPCQNGAPCVNHLGYYTCTCKTGWTGRNCETDIQPPVLSGCSANISVFVSTVVSQQNWTKPTFTDPMGTPLMVTSNYDENSFEFPWGDFTVQYVALKPANGLQTECSFTISIRPNPCRSITPPNQGVVVCNGWRRDFARVCLFLCLHGYTFPPGFSAQNWYNCGASGAWLPPSLLRDCVPEVVAPSRVSSQDPALALKDCRNNTEAHNVKTYYVDSLKKSQFNQLCEDYPSDCSSSSVDLIC